MTSNKLYVVCIGAVIALCSYSDKNTVVHGKITAKKTYATGSAAADTVSCACAGILQTPINIFDRMTIPVALPKLTFTASATKMYIQNDKKAIKAAPVDPLNNQNRLTFNHQEYYLVDFHFHHKSEHLFDGKADSMEVHFVYQSRQTKAYVVVGLLISQGPMFNPVLGEIWKEFPAHGNYAKETLSFPVDISRIIKYSDADTYYSYVGSLTTSPYTEGIAWIVLKKRLVLNAAQIAKFASYYKNNARKVFPVNNRLVLRIR